MAMYDRGGRLIDTGSIGYYKVIRQQVMAPGESIRGHITGDVNFESLREVDQLIINAHLAVFATPLRWLDDKFTTHLIAGPDAAADEKISYVTKPLYDVGAGSGGSSLTVSMPKFWHEAPLRIYNEWYKYPTAADATGMGSYKGLPACNLEHSWTRLRDAQSFDASDNEDRAPVVSSAVKLEDLALAHAKYNRVVETDYLNHERYMEVLKDMYGADGNREVDKVPLLLKKEELGIRTDRYPATDGASLGQWANVFNYSVDMRWRFTAPEHFMITYVLVNRFEAFATNERHPLCVDDLPWEDLFCAPGFLSRKPAQSVRIKDVTDGTSSTVLGTLPSGWQWRARNNIAGYKVSDRGTFALMQVPTTLAETRDATRRQDAFRSQALDDCIYNLNCSEMSTGPVSSAKAGLYLGETGGDRAAYPNTGKQL